MVFLLSTPPNLKSCGRIFLNFISDNSTLYQVDIKLASTVRFWVKEFCIHIPNIKATPCIIFSFAYLKCQVTFF